MVEASALHGSRHTLYRPLLHHLAGRTFCRRRTAGLPFTGFDGPAELGSKNSLLRRYAQR
jgi:hypothetical protein